MRRAFAMALVLTVVATFALADDYFAISVVDDATGRGVPLVELRTVDGTRHWTDSGGLVAFNESGLMNRKVYFHVQSDGYEYPADGFGFRGKALLTKSGESAELRLQRINVAQRLYRVTGAGIYRDSVRLGRNAPIEHPLLNAEVAGSDSVNSIIFGDRVHWFWGDTNRLAYPLGCFHVPGAVSKLPAQGGLDPAVGVNLEYYTCDDGFVASTAEMPGDGPTWIDGLCVIQEPNHGEQMFAKYVKVRKFLEVYERGLVEFDPETRRFSKVVTFDFDAPLYPFGHALRQTVKGTDYVYFGNPYPLVRVPATAAALRDPGQYEAFTCLEPGSTLGKSRIDRNATGGIQYAWKSNTAAPGNDDLAKWQRTGKLRDGESLLALRDVETGKPVKAHAGSVSFNAFRNRYVMIAEESGGTSFLGEVWYAEADTPVGPWIYACKIVTHEKYSFYNPRHHPMFDQDGGRRIFFEGTYSTFFSGIEKATPRYDYNQIMYSLELDDERLNLPVAVYRSASSPGGETGPNAQGTIGWMACDRPGEGLVAIGSDAKSTGKLSLNGSQVRFYALPAESETAPATTIELFEWSSPETNKYWYGVADSSGPKGFKRSVRPLCRVWRYPLSFALPAD